MLLWAPTGWGAQDGEEDGAGRTDTDAGAETLTEADDVDTERANEGFTWRCGSKSLCTCCCWCTSVGVGVVGIANADGIALPPP